MKYQIDRFAACSFLLFFLLSGNFCKAQEKQLPEALKPFVLQGYEMLDFVEGDLNNDKKADAILILKVLGEDTITMDAPKRPFLLLLRKQDGKLKVEKRNDSLVKCRQCGGVFGDPYENTEIAANGFSITFYGGSSWRWGYTYRFEYNPGKQDWFLIHESQISYHNTEPELDVKKVNIDTSELGMISFDHFNVDPEYQETKWKVICTKAYFYNDPKKGSKPRKAYLVKNDLVTGFRSLENFIQVDYKNKKDVYTSGFILKTCLQPVQ